MTITCRSSTTTGEARPEPKQAPVWIKGDPVLGCLRAFRTDRLSFLSECARQGEVTAFRLASRTFHLLTNPAHIQRVLVDNARNYGKETRGQDLLKPVLGDGLLTAEGPFWLKQRRTAQPAFHRDRIASFVPLMNEATRASLEAWEVHARTGAAFDLGEELSRLTLRVVGRALLSTDLADEASEIGAALTVVLRDRSERTTSVIDFFLGEDVPTPRNRRFKAALAVLDRVVLETIDERRRNPTDRGDLLSLFMNARDPETGDAMDDRLLRDQVMTMVLAGHETTANALTWTFVLLSQHPAVERAARAEVGRVLGDREPTMEDLQQLRYVRAVFEEAMRLYPPIWTLARSVIEDDEVGGRHIAAGTYVFLTPWVTHRHPAYWENPEGFDPERFLEPRPDRPRFAYFPFGGGARQCIGNTFALAEGTLILARTLARYRLDLEPGHVIVPEPLMTLRPKGGVRVTAHRV